jgi:hypothetical protein
MIATTRTVDDAIGMTRSAADQHDIPPAVPTEPDASHESRFEDQRSWSVQQPVPDRSADGPEQRHTERGVQAEDAHDQANEPAEDEYEAL